MSWLCWLGLHRFEYRSEFTGDVERVYMRCTRPCCKRWPNEVAINVENVRKPW